MRRADALRIALREFADPSCRRCGGRGFRNEVAPANVCLCVHRHAELATPGPSDGEQFDWQAVARRAQQIHAADLIERVPDTWS